MSIYLNPVVARLTRRGKWPSARAALWLAFGLGLASLAITTWETLHMESDKLGTFSTVLLVLVLLVTILSPPITAVVATILASRDVRNEMHELLRVTTLSEATLVKGYVFAALHRMRILLMLVVGLMPALAVGMVQVGILVSVIFYSMMLPPPPYSLDGTYGSPPGIDSADVTGPALASIAFSIGLWGLHWLAAALGVGLALRWGGSTMVTIIAPMAMLLIAIGLPVLVLLTNGMGLVVAATTLAPYILGAVMMRLARYWAREP